MKKCGSYVFFFPIVLLVLCSLIFIAVFFSRSIRVWSESRPVLRTHKVIIDAGHGGVDGGATSCTGVLESKMNLQIAHRLDDLLHLIGINTQMIRTTDVSVYTSGQTIAAKKVSDLKERVRIVNSADNPILISIHMNHFTDSRYCGAQVFYAPTERSKELAVQLQSIFKKTINTGSNRQVKKADGVYLMQHIQCPGALIECGFISNPEEDAKLNDPAYQQKICCVIAAGLSSFLAGA